ncbi:MAG: hypothetical protein Q4D56_08110 [Bacteroides sp.]|nr:hypothetical protein [Bacteroides sp.]
MKTRILTFAFVLWVCCFLAYVLVCFSACSDDASTTSITTDDEVNPIAVEVVFSPNGFGDLCYNDNILYGLQCSYEELDFDLTFFVPEDVATGMERYADWLAADLDAGVEKSLFIFASSEYEESFRSASLPTDDRKEILLFETADTIPGAYTFRLGMYGISYAIGGERATADTLLFGSLPNVAIVAANSADRVVRSAVEGFADGYLSYGGEVCDIFYLSDDISGGYNQVEEAYQLCSQLADEGYTFVFPVVGGSNMGIYRYSRENFMVVTGMDGDMSAYTYSMLTSLVKRIDLALADFLRQWSKGEEVAQHQDFLFGSDYLQIANYWPYEPADSVAIRADAVQKERVYEGLE